MSLGSDTGGSIRQPAAFNGIVGLKPTYGTVSRFGLIAFGSSLDQIGTFSPTVKENAQLLNVIASEDAKDSTSAPVRVADFTSKIGQDIKGMKIALPKEYLGEGIDPEVKETILNAAKHFEKLGATVEEVPSWVTAILPPVPSRMDGSLVAGLLIWYGLGKTWIMPVFM